MTQMLDPFATIFTQTDVHRRAHGCSAFPFNDGPRLGVLASAIAAKRILELGTARGYTACWLAYGSPGAHIENIECDAEHVRHARAHITHTGHSN